MFARKTLQLSILVLFALVTIGIWTFALAPSAQRELKVSFLDVGQGDAIFVETPSGKQILVDGGRNSAVVRELSKHMVLFDRSIDVVVATHPDEDHIGGLVDVLERYRVGMLLRSGVVRNSPAVTAFENVIQNMDVQMYNARRGQVLDFGDGVTMTVLFPDRNVAGLESNTASIVTRVTFGEHEFLFTGDSPEEIETYLVSLDGEALASDVLKAGHHGSKTSSGATFVGFVAPEYVIFSRGCDNRYGHPHPDVVARYEQFDIEAFDTCLNGAITFTTDGTLLRIKKDR